jgi:alkaline phosphatase
MNTSSLRRLIGILIITAAFLAPAALLAGPARESAPAGTPAATAAPAPAPAPAPAAKLAKYVFLFIGDGMGMPQINTAEIYANAVSSKDITVKKLRFSQFPAQGLTTTYDAGTFITDSASAGTAIATGNKTLSGVLNMDPAKKLRYPTIAEQAKAAGMKVGIISSVSIDHATPASFYAKAPSRNDYYDIAAQIAASGFDLFAGGGLLQPTGKNKDQPHAMDLAKAQDYTVLTAAAAFQALKPGSGKVWYVNPVLQDSSALAYDMDRGKDDLSLADLTKKAIELLANDKGFFIMVEGGKIDWACHANDAAASIRDTLAMDEAVGQAMAFAAAHPDETLIVVTGDHETGGMTIGFAGTKYDTFFDKIAPQKGSYVAFNDTVLAPFKAKNAKTGTLDQLLPAIQGYFGIDYATLTDAEKELLGRAFQRSMGGQLERAAQEDVYLLYGGYEPLTVALTHLVNQKAGIGWTSYSHTGVPVMTFASGAGQGLFDGYYDNTDIYRKLVQAMGLKVTVAAR